VHGSLVGRQLRSNDPGDTHHVGNRGIAHRSAFEAIGEISYFLEMLERAAERYEIRVLAYSILTTHFHLLVRSPLGNLDRAMACVQAAYVRRFNLPRERDGALFRSRYWSRPVRGARDRLAVARYIDANPVRAGLAEHCWEYPWGSAWHYRRGSMPSWLDGSWIAECVPRTAQPGDGRSRYPPWQEAGADSDWVVERRVLARGAPEIDLRLAASDELRLWLRANSTNADGRVATWPIVTPARLRSAIFQRAQDRPHLQFACHRRLPASVWRILEAGLLRAGCGLLAREVSEQMDIGRRSAIQLRHAHDELLASNDGYARLAEELIRAAADGLDC
jgi:REP element-mobilizing transposase RayT